MTTHDFGSIARRYFCADFGSIPFKPRTDFCPLNQLSVSADFHGLQTAFVSFVNSSCKLITSFAITSSRFLDEMRAEFPQHFALTVLLAFTGLRFCHATALRWDDWDDTDEVIRVVRKQVRGRVGPVSRKKQAPREYPVDKRLAKILRWHRQRMIAEQAPGLAEGWMFPTSVGTLRAPSSLSRAWKHCLQAAGIDKRFTVHGLRYTFTDLVRRADVDAVVRRALTGHVTERMQQHYSNVGLDEKRSAVAGVYRLVTEASAREDEPEITNDYRSEHSLDNPAASATFNA